MKQCPIKRCKMKFLDKETMILHLQNKHKSKNGITRVNFKTRAPCLFCDSESPFPSLTAKFSHYLDLHPNFMQMYCCDCQVSVNRFKT